MMKGVSGEAASLAGHLQLSNLCWIYDNNRITIEGHTDWAFSEDVATRFIAYAWNVTRVGDAWPEDAKFLVPEEVRKHFQEGMGSRGRFHEGKRRGTRPPLQHSRARHGLHSQWAVPQQGAPVWLRIPDLQRLQPAHDQAQCPHGNPGDLHLHPRFHRGGRGWATSSKRRIGTPFQRALLINPSSTPLLMHSRVVSCVTAGIASKSSKRYIWGRSTSPVTSNRQTARVMNGSMTFLVTT